MITHESADSLPLVDDMLQWVCSNDLAFKVLIRYMDIAGNEEGAIVRTPDTHTILFRFEICAYTAYENGLQQGSKD